MNKLNNKLAILNGPPIRSKKWPKWPISDRPTEKAVMEVLNSGRWTLSGPYVGKESRERKFSKDYAKFNGSKYAVPTTNGTSSLTVALLALNIGYGDEVLVPGLTWVACASSVLAIGAVPVLIDIDPANLCMSPVEAEKSITDSTKAIMLVHAFCTVADLDAFVALSEKYNIPLIEDCSQAHGAEWNHKKVGTFGKVGCFSMQQSKVLTCGEGGVAITDDKNLYELMEQARSDGRLFVSEPKIGQMELFESGKIQGHNMCMSEFHAAILSEKLKHLKSENIKRERNAKYLADGLSKIDGLSTLKSNPKATHITYYNFVVRVDLEKFGNNSIDAISNALCKELGVYAHPVYQPMNNHTLYNPTVSSRVPKSGKAKKRFNPHKYILPASQEARRTCLIFPHNVLLGSHDDLQDIVKAFAKIKAHSVELLNTQQNPSKDAF